MDLAILDPATMPDSMKDRASRTDFRTQTVHLPRRMNWKVPSVDPVIGYRFGCKNDRKNDHERYHERDYDSPL